MKYRARIEMGQSPPSTEYSSLSEDGLPFLQGTADFGAASPTPRVYCGSPTKLARAGDILFSVRAPVGELNLADREFGIGRGLCAIRPQQHWDARFAWWALHEACHQLKLVSTGSTYDAVATEDVGNLWIETTAPGAQRAIADCLDRETARLDALVAAKERVLGLLAEKRRALITRTVTRDFGSIEQPAPPALSTLLIEGDRRGSEASGGKDHAPSAGGDGVTTDASRYRVRLKYRARIEMGQSPPSTEYSSLSEDGLPFLQGTADFGAASPTPRVYCGSPTKLARAGDILFSVRAPVGELNLADREFGIGRGLCAIRPQQHWDARFAWWALHEACHQLKLVSTGSTYDAVATEDVGNLWIETTAPGAQRAIADYLDRETARLDALVVEIKSTITLLKERRGALIAAAVKGQIEVGSAA